MGPPLWIPTSSSSDIYSESTARGLCHCIGLRTVRWVWLHWFKNIIGCWIIPQYIGEYNPPTNLVGGFSPLWKMMEFVSWDDDYSQDMESHKSHVPNHQPVMLWNEFHVISMLEKCNWISEHVAIQITHLSFRNQGWILSRSLMSVSKVFRLSKRWNSPVRQNSRITEAKPFTSYAYRWWYFYGL